MMGPFPALSLQPSWYYEYPTTFLCLLAHICLLLMSPGLSPTCLVIITFFFNFFFENFF
jgi:hypothetical protein